MMPLDRRRFLLGSLATGAALAWLPRRRAEATVPLDKLVTGLNGAGTDLYRQLAGKDGNVFLSPLSIGLAFAMLEAGARGQTRDELREVFGFDGDLGAACKALSTALTSAKAAKVAIANRLWAAKDLVAERAFLDVTSRQFGAAVERLDFAQNEAAAKKINAWVAKQTADKIKNLVPASALDAMTRLVLTNAIYFKGAWETGFKAESTSDAPFHRLAGDPVTAKLMFAHRKLAVGGDADAQVARFPYQGGYSMFVALPRARDGLRALEPKIDGARLAAWTQSALLASATKLEVWLPKFRARFHASLPEQLKALGVKLAFDAEEADLSGIAPRDREPLYVTDAIHEGFVDVNEEGTEAAAATAIVVGRENAVMEPPRFRADHPFFYWIRHDATGAVLFAGRLVDPTLPS